jgi:hypothetical protein
MKRTNRVIVRWQLAALWCSTGLGHIILLSDTFELLLCAAADLCLVFVIPVCWVLNINVNNE